MGLKDWLKEKYNQTKDLLRNAADIFCDAVDYLRYDQGFIASTLRAVDTVVGAVTSIPMTVVGKIVEVTYYGTGRLLGVSKEEMHKPIEMLENFVNKSIEKGMNYLADKGVNVRFLGDLGCTISHYLQYTSLGQLSREGIQKVQGIYNEGARRYRNNLIKEAQAAKNRKIGNVNRDLAGWHKRNTKKYKENKAIGEARRNAIKEDYQRRLREIENMRLLKVPKFWKYLPKMFQGPFNDLLDYFYRLGYNTGWVLEDNLMNFWDNLLGKMGNHGFHTCPYGCQRPIPNAFKGCTELLAVFPDYFDN